MAKKKIKTISSEFNIDETLLDSLDIVNSFLNFDTPLFIDPMLIRKSKHKEICVSGFNNYNKVLSEIIECLISSKVNNDPLWKLADKKFYFPEINWTGLGYGAMNGSGIGKKLKDEILNTTKQIIDMDIKNPDIFMSLSLIEDGVGADRISDMTTNLILDSLISFTKRINKTLKIKTDRLKFTKFKKNFDDDFIVNPYTSEPLLFVPKDIVRDLPIANDWSDIVNGINLNNKLRDDVNTSLMELTSNTKKKVLRERALSSKYSFELLFSIINEPDSQSYNFIKDMLGVRFMIELISNTSKYKTSKINKLSANDTIKFIINRFKEQVENKGLWKEFWVNDLVNKNEKSIQRIFFAIAYAYCDANDLDISPESDNGTGPVDFKVSKGNSDKVVVEIKLSTNPNIVTGYSNQLEIYKSSNNTDNGHYIIIDFSGTGRGNKKINKLYDIKSECDKNNIKTSEIHIIDASEKLSASKRK